MKLGPMTGPQRAGLIVGVLAALTTVVAMSDLVKTWPSWLEATIFFGVIIASMPFGGLHDGPPWVPLVIVSALVNGLIWGSIVGGMAGFFRRVFGQPRAT